MPFIRLGGTLFWIDPAGVYVPASGPDAAMSGADWGEAMAECATPEGGYKWPEIAEEYAPGPFIRHDAPTRPDNASAPGVYLSDKALKKLWNELWNGQ